MELLDKFPMISVKDISDFAGAILLVVPMQKVTALAEKGSITKRQINSISKKIESALNVKVFISYSLSAQKGNIEAGLKAIANANFKKGKITDLDVSFIDSKTIDLFSFCKSLSTDDTTQWEALVNSYLNGLNIKINNFHYEQKLNPEPNAMIILRAAKKIFPFTIAELTVALETGGYHVDSNDWLNSKLDLLRKKNLIIRNRDGVYRFTQLGLDAVPITKSRQSSDVERILYLARKHL
jgi:hypothetical protein